MTSSEEIILNVQGLHKSFHGKTVLKNLSFAVPAGAFLCLLGPSGCGKSTLLRLLAGLESADSGVLQKKPSLVQGFVFQEAQLLSWRNALENVRLPLELQNSLSVEQQSQRASDVLKQVGLAESAERFPHELSGGMKMRVSIARALSAKPKILFMDEPFAALDEIHRHQLQIQLRELSSRQNLTVVFVTHSSSEAAFLADRILVMGSTGQFAAELPVSYTKRRDEELRISPEYQQQQLRIGEALLRGSR